MFDGRLENFREEGGIVKTDEEKRKMAEKRKSWQKHDFEKRREERQSNEDADILSFEFHSLKKQHDRDRDHGRDRDRDFGRDRGFNHNRDRDHDRDRDYGRDRDRGRNRDWKSQDRDDDYRHQFKGKSYKSRDERQEDRKKFFQKKK